MAGTMEETLENSQKNINYFLEVPIENNELCVDVASVEMDNRSKFDEIMKMNTKKEERVAENLRGLEHFGKDFRLKITRSLSPTPFKKKTQQIISTRSSLSSSGSSSSTPQQARRSSFLKPLDLLFGSESSMSSDQTSPLSPRNMIFLGQIYREHFQ
jgi:hypothetical protein